MPIPHYQSIMLPLLRLAGDGQEHRFRDAVDALADEFGLDDEARAELLPSGNQPVFNNRVGWARTYLKQAGLLNAPRRGFFRITDAGRQLLVKQPARITVETLEAYEAFRAFRERGREKVDTADEAVIDASDTPDDSM